jgi:drug/metabolite transporter (DMT)-like permease
LQVRVLPGAPKMPTEPTPKLASGAGVGAILLAAAAFSWGFVFVKAAGLPAATIAFWRLVIGAAALVVASLVLRAPRPQTYGAVIGAGLCFGVHQLLYTAATQLTSIAIVTLMGAIQPLLVALVSRRLLGERVPPLLLVWSLAAIAGIAIVVWANLGDPSRSALGDLLAVINLLAFTAFFLFVKRARTEGVHTLTLTTWMLAIALLIVAPALLFAEPRVPITGHQWLLIAALALLPGNGHLLVNWALRRVSAALASLTLAGVPLLAAIWAHLVFGEPYGIEHVAGMLLVAAAVEGGRRAERVSAAERLGS